MQKELLTNEQLRLAVEAKWIEHIKLCQDNFIYFVKEVWPDFICRLDPEPKRWGHHQHIAAEFTKISSKKKGRLIINMPPRHTKSEFASYLFPAWMIGKYPNLKIMQVSHNAELSSRFGSKVRNLMEQKEYKNIFGDVKLREDSKAKGRWETNHGGEYFAAGVGGSITGRGADLDSGNPVWPEYWELEELEKVKASLPIRNWSAQYMQNPTSEEGAILKREWWQVWEHERIPKLQHVIQSYDTAFSAKETADYSAITTWGIFFPQEDGKPAMILLDAIKGKYDFPELKAIAMDQYKYWEPETVIIEAKATGEPLMQEFRRMGIPVIPFVPSRGKDKHSRVNATAPVFEGGQIYYPEGEKYAEEVIEECAAFPHGANDDYVDSTTQAVLRYRQGNFIDMLSDYEEESYNIPKEHKYYG